MDLLGPFNLELTPSLINGTDPLTPPMHLGALSTAGNTSSASSSTPYNNKRIAHVKQYSMALVPNSQLAPDYHIGSFLS